MRIGKSRNNAVVFNTPMLATATCISYTVCPELLMAISNAIRSPITAGDIVQTRRTTMWAHDQCRQPGKSSAYASDRLDRLIQFTGDGCQAGKKPHCISPTDAL